MNLLLDLFGWLVMIVGGLALALVFASLICRLLLWTDARRDRRIFTAARLPPAAEHLARIEVAALDELGVQNRHRCGLVTGLASGGCRRLREHSGPCAGALPTLPGGPT